MRPPTARTNSVVVMGGIDAHESRNAAVIDIEAAYLQLENDQRITTAVCGKTA